jgi:hypothetical protein
MHRIAHDLNEVIVAVNKYHEDPICGDLLQELSERLCSGLDREIIDRVLKGVHRAHP